MKSVLQRFKKRKMVQQDGTSVPSILTLDELRCRFPDGDLEHLKTVIEVQSYTMTSPERIMALCNAVDYIATNRIDGDIVECGVWRGGSMAAAARTLQMHDSSGRRLWMYDTYDGMSDPTEEDVDFLGQTAAGLMEIQDKLVADSVWCRSPLNEVKNVMAQTRYPMDQIEFVEGDVEKTLPSHCPEKIALLRLDTDWYQSTKCELNYLFPRMAPGGVLIVDDYGHWNGCRQAVDEYFEQHDVQIFLNRIDYTGRIGVYWPKHGC